MARKVITLAGIGILALGIGFGIRYYSEGGLPVTILQNALQKFVAATTYSYTGNLKITALNTTGAPNEINSLDINITGTADTTDPKKPKGTASLSTKIPENSNVNTLVESGFLKIDALFIGKVMYLKVNAAPKASFDISPLLNQWIKIDPTELNKIANVPEPQVSEVAPEKLAELRTDFTQNRIIRLTSPLTDTKIDGQTMRRFAVIIDKERLMTFVPRLVAWQLKVTSQKLTPDVQTGVDKFIGYLRDTPASDYPSGEIFVGRSDGMVHQITFNKTIQPKVTTAASNQAKTSEVTISLTADYKNYGEKVTIVEPTGSISMQDAIAKVMAAAKQPAATVSYEKIDWWLGTLPKAIEAQIMRAKQTFTAKYLPHGKTTIKPSLFDACGAYQLSQAINELPPTEIDRIHKNQQLTDALGVADKTTDSTFRAQIQTAIYDEYIKTEILAEIGAEEVTAIDAATTGDFNKIKPSKSACKTVGIATQ